MKIAALKTSRLAATIIVAAVVLSIYSIDLVLARLEKREVRSEAQSLSVRGAALLRTGNAATAVELLQRAYTLDRNDRNYQLLYAEALLRTGKKEQASAHLYDVLRSRPNDGKANLLLARLARAQEDFPNESAYFHRAIYGVWDGHAEAESNAARLEWIDELKARGDNKLLLAELLPLAIGTTDQAVLRKVALDLRLAGSPARSAELYGTMLQSNPDDPALLQGLGQAETESGRYAAARTAFLNAFRKDPANTSIRQEMELASALSEIDPTLRRIPSGVKFARSLRVLRLVRDAVAACGAQPADLAGADESLTRKNLNTSNEAAEELLQAAESLWSRKAVKCEVPPLVNVLMRKLAE